ncbi:MAG: hypothetical protein M1817_004679 [Caeruleum heppii]|nr:MAG: hypothetical protein M1817_004679 [Caeruleum heppii]
MSDSTNSNGAGNGVIPFDPVKYTIIAAFSAVAWYNVVEINAQVFLTFKRHRGLYFWSLLITSWGIAIHVLSFILKFFIPSANWIMCATLTTIGWYPMVTGQSVVLYSRLHLVVRDTRILRFVLWMIIIDVFLFHVPTTVLTYGSNSAASAEWLPRFNIMERLQMTAFTIQEIIISGIYVWATLKLLRPIYHARTRKVMMHLIYINLIIVGMDAVLLVMEYTNNYDIQASLKPMVYSIKLKLEFAVLNQLMVLANTGLTEGATSENHFSDKGNGRNGSVATTHTNYSLNHQPSPPVEQEVAKASDLLPRRERKKRTPPLNRNNVILKTQDVSVKSEMKRHRSSEREGRSSPGSAEVSPTRPVPAKSRGRKSFMSTMKMEGRHKGHRQQDSDDQGNPFGSDIQLDPYGSATGPMAGLQPPEAQPRKVSLKGTTIVGPDALHRASDKVTADNASDSSMEMSEYRKYTGRQSRSAVTGREWMGTTDSPTPSRNKDRPSESSSVSGPFGRSAETAAQPDKLDEKAPEVTADSRIPSSDPIPWGKNIGGPPASSARIPGVPDDSKSTLTRNSDVASTNRMFDGQGRDGTYEAKVWRGSSAGIEKEIKDAGFADQLTLDPYSAYIGSGTGAGSVWGKGVVGPQPPPIPHDQGLVGIGRERPGLRGGRRPSVNEFGTGSDDEVPDSVTKKKKDVEAGW